MFRSIDEEHGIVEGMSLNEFLQELFYQIGYYRWIQPYMKDSIRFWIDNSVQPIFFIVESDHGFVKRNVIRTFVNCGCRSYLWTQLWTAFWLRLTPNLYNFRTVSESERSEIKSNTEFHQLVGCLLSLHETQIEIVATPAEAVNLWHEHYKIVLSHFFYAQRNSVGHSVVRLR